MLPRILLIGAHRAATGALEALLEGLSPDLPFPVLIAHHRPPDGGGEDPLLERLWACCPLPVLEPDDKDELLPGRAYLGPAGYHLLVEEGRCALSRAALSTGPRPGIDALFEAAADAWGSAVLAVLLSQGEADGRLGLEVLRERGARTLMIDVQAQSPQSEMSGVGPWLLSVCAAPKLGVST